MIISHLLPNARAWRITISKKLKQFFEGLTNALEIPLILFIDQIYEDRIPATTRELDLWEAQFGLRDIVLTTQERIDRLDATWKALGGQSPIYIQDTLQAAGFPVYVHEWWVPGSEPTVDVKVCVTPRTPVGTILVNKILLTSPDLITLCGEAVAECGEAVALCGNFISLRTDFKVYDTPTDPLKHPYFLYIGDSIFPNIANVDINRKDEFEALCLKICPTQLWLGLLVNYV